ncbi:hypothetical protein ACFVHB_34195 [Kitasatospora sp. NPDC127111]|uniref:hypothetical protein n=1 Tax=Kitasatospora sp. NPDC127111 TaxID=3345363 RepID=UPI00362AE66A
MPSALTTASVLQCIHGGRLTVPAAGTALTVDGQPVLVQSDLAAATIAGCANTNASAGQTPCLKVTSVIAGLSTVLTVRGQPVLLDTARGLTNATPPAPVMWQVVSAGQTKLTAR